MQILHWRERLALDRRVVAFGEDERDGVLWVLVHCRNRWAADSLLNTLLEEECLTPARRSADTLWLERSAAPPTSPVPLVFTWLEVVVG